MNGIEKEGDENIQGRHIMNALNDMREDNIKPVRYEQFVQDPLGKIAKEMEEKYQRKKKLDDYVKSIKFNKGEKI